MQSKNRCVTAYILIYLLNRYFLVNKDKTYALLFAPHFNKTIVATGSLDTTVTLTNCVILVKLKEVISVNDRPNGFGLTLCEVFPELIF